MTVEPNVPIWRYFDLAKYVGLLARGLFFARPSALRANEPWEGSWGEVDFIESLDATVHASPDGVEKWQKGLQDRHAKQDIFGVSCWHESPTESAALWQLYSPLGFGVAVKSTPAKVQAALGNRRVEVRRIDYGGHKDRRLGDDPLGLLSTKRPEFKHEAEMRFFAALRTMKVRYFADTDTLFIEFRVAPVAETRGLDENMLLDVDAQGNFAPLQWSMHLSGRVPRNSRTSRLPCNRAIDRDVGKPFTLPAARHRRRQPAFPGTETTTVARYHP